MEPVLHVGNLEAKRDFTDVRDIIRGYYLALEKGEPGEVYNICTGNVYSIKEIIDMLVEMTSIKVEIKIDKERMRPSDVPLLIGDNSKFKQATGWAPTIPFNKTLEDVLAYWRETV
jgi:GDP-4-dehydro-6-deoxy-D-mannose reductase